MAEKNFFTAYSNLPLFLHRAFAHGSGGMRPRLDGLNMAFEFMSATQHDQLCSRQKLCADLLFFAFEVMPLDGNFAGQILKAQKVLPHIQPQQLALAAASSRFRHIPDSNAQVSELLKDANINELVTLIDKGVSESNHNIYWLRQALEAAALGADPAWLAGLADALARKGKSVNTPPALAALESWFMGMAFWFDAEYERALAHFRAAPLQWPGLEEMIGHCLCRLGANEEGLAVLLAVASERPWHVSLIKTIHDRLNGFDRPLPAVPAPTAVLLYSWNKAADLNATLSALSASAGDMARIICLDNGSSDSTPEVVSAWSGRLGSDLFHSVRLPVNIGAAAARNWLAMLPETLACEYAVYIDDDTAVSTDWLRHLFRGAALYPGASSYGLRVVDAHAPFIVQSGPLHLTPLFAPLAGREPLPGQPADGGEEAETAFSPARAYAEPFNVSGTGGLGLEQADMGQFDFIGPCVSTTGCCHMFRTSELAKRGGFSLALSPSQYDDLEFDLRAAVGGGLSCHNGFCAVKHFKRTGGGAQLKGPAFGNALGNKYKLHGFYDAKQITEAAHMEAETLEHDFLARLKNLDNFGKLTLS